MITSASDRRPSAFTLIELIMVMVIIAIASAAIAPSLRGFAAGRRVHDTARQILSLAHYAHDRSAAESRVWRLNFDSAKRTYWLTAQTDAGDFQPPASDQGEHFAAPQDINISLDVTSQPNTQMNLAADVQQTAVAGPTPIGQNYQPNQLLANIHTEGQYVEFQPTGRTDVATIRLTDVLGDEVIIGCPSASDSFRVLTPQEAQR